MEKYEPCWSEIKFRYIVLEERPTVLARHYDVPLQSIYSRINAEGWRQQREALHDVLRRDIIKGYTGMNISAIILARELIEKAMNKEERLCREEWQFLSKVLGKVWPECPPDETPTTPSQTLYQYVYSADPVPPDVVAERNIRSQENAPLAGGDSGPPFREDDYCY